MSARNPVSSELPGSAQILRWEPPRWDGFLGNTRLKRVLRTVALKSESSTEMGRLHSLNGAGFLVTGESRSGKTSLINHCLRAMVCHERDPVTLDPCSGHACPACELQPELAGALGFFLRARDGRRLVTITVIDGTQIASPRELLSELREAAWGHGFRLLFLDEAHRLKSRGMDELLLKAVEELKMCWILATARPDALEDMLRKRLIIVRTEPPSLKELALWLADRCDEWEIPWTSAAVERVAEKSNRIVGLALQALALAALDRQEGLTEDLVENFWSLDPGD